MNAQHTCQNFHLKQQQDQWLGAIWKLIDKTMEQIEPAIMNDPVKKQLDDKFHAWRTIPYLQHRINTDAQLMGLGDPIKVFAYWNTVRSQKSRGVQILIQI